MGTQNRYKQSRKRFRQNKKQLIEEYKKIKHENELLRQQRELLLENSRLLSEKLDERDETDIARLTKKEDAVSNILLAITLFFGFLTLFFWN